MSIPTSDPTVRQLFNTDVHYQVPPYQRRYVWNEETQWMPLWEDIVSLAEKRLVEPRSSTEETHFLGTLVLRRLDHLPTEPELVEVIDGQQRLTTLQLLLGAAAKTFAGRSERHARLLQPFVRNNPDYTSGNKDHRFKVWPSRYDREAFRSTMDSGVQHDSAEASQIAKAHRFFQGETETWLDQAQTEDDLDRKCDALFDVLTQRLQVVTIAVTGEDVANAIFETLNARGTPLQAWDLVKNHMYERSGPDPDFEEWFDDELLKFDEDWWQHESGAGRNRRSNVDLYVNHFLVLRRKKEVKGRTSRDVHRAFGEYLSEPADDGEKSVKSVGTDFSRLGDTYEEVMLTARTDKHGQFLHHWRVEGHGVLAPVILWLWSSGVPDQQLNRAVRALDSYFGRRLVCQSSSKDYRELSIGLLNELDSKGADNAGDATVKYLKKRAADVDTLQWPDNAELRSVLTERPVYGKLTSARVQMVLEAVERQMRIDADGHSDSPLVPDGLSIEHVMPQKWEAHWPRPKGGTAEETARQRRHRLMHTIGNLTLVSPKLNSALRNAAWKTKRGTLKEHSKLYISDDVNDHAKQWNEAAIIERSHRMVDLLIRVWPGPDAI